MLPKPGTPRVERSETRGSSRKKGFAASFLQEKAAEEGNTEKR